MQVARGELAPPRGARLRNTWVSTPEWGIPQRKLGQSRIRSAQAEESGNALWDEPAAHQVVGRVTAYQAGDGSLV
jgi:hypothetical protein